MRSNPTSTSPADDPVYRARRLGIAAQAAGADAAPLRIDYLTSEHETWLAAKAALDQRWNSGVVAPEILTARGRLDLPADRVPHLDEVTAGLAASSGFEFRAVPGLVPVEEFFGSLAAGRFLSTQYVRHHASPLYTPEPDIIHEVIGHGTCLADPDLAALHRSAGQAMLRMETEQGRQFVADVFWFSAEFGVVQPHRDAAPKAYGAGLLSSVGELDHFATGARIVPVDIAAMGTVAYDIAHYQPVLFSASSIGSAVDLVGGFFDAADDDLVAALRTSVVSGPAAHRTGRSALPDGRPDCDELRQPMTA
jgi:phenylalanine-4-hydroxylase